MPPTSPPNYDNAQKRCEKCAWMDIKECDGPDKREPWLWAGEQCPWSEIKGEQ